MSKKLKTNVSIFLIVCILCLIAIGISYRAIDRFNVIGNAVTVVLSPFQNLFFSINQKFTGITSYFSDVQTLKVENEQLKTKIDNLEKENREFLEYKKTNVELKEALNIKPQMSNYDCVTADVVANDIGNLFSVLTINKGSRDGIKKDSPVITGRGLVGKVKNVYLLTSTVISILDEDSSIGGRITKTRDVVVVKGDLTLKNDYLCRVEYIPQDVDVAVGDTIETAGLGDLLPKGLIVGKVSQVRKRTNELNKYALLEPSVDFRRIEEVMVLKLKTTDN